MRAKRRPAVYITVSCRGIEVENQALSLLYRYQNAHLQLVLLVGHWPLVTSSVAELVAIGRGEVIKDCWTTGAWCKVSVSVSSVVFASFPELTVWVLHRDDLLVIIQVVQQRREDPPAGIQFVITHKVGVVAFQRVEDERLVGFRDLEVRKAAAVGKVELGDNGLHTQARQFRVHLDIDRFVGLHADDELVARNVLEDAGCDILELDTNFGLLLVQRCIS